MAEPRSKNPAGAIKYYTTLLVEEQHKLQESLAAISEYAEALRRVTEDTGRRLLTRD